MQHIVAALWRIISYVAIFGGNYSFSSICEVPRCPIRAAFLELIAALSVRHEGR